MFALVVSTPLVCFVAWCDLGTLFDGVVEEWRVLLRDHALGRKLLARYDLSLFSSDGIADVVSHPQPQTCEWEQHSRFINQCSGQELENTLGSKAEQDLIQWMKCLQNNQKNCYGSQKNTTGELVLSSHHCIYEAEVRQLLLWLPALPAHWLPQITRQ